MEQYTELQKLGEGAFGEVYTVRSKDSGGIYVMKKIRISSVSASQQITLVNTARPEQNDNNIADDISMG